MDHPRGLGEEKSYILDLAEPSRHVPGRFTTGTYGSDSRDDEADMDDH